MALCVYKCNDCGGDQLCIFIIEGKLPNEPEYCPFFDDEEANWVEIEL
jgi:hypothetical protein